MAAKSDVRLYCNHLHCEVCGTCLTIGSTYHPCRPEPIDQEVLATFLLETRNIPAKPTPIPLAEEKRGMQFSTKAELQH